jgi:CTP synthase (UTP-ammonia lyase)
MTKSTRIAIIGDFDESRPSHAATGNALMHSAAVLLSNIEMCWLPTESLEEAGNLLALETYSGIWGAPGIPQSSLGLVNAIQVAREKHIPYLGT